MKSEIESYADGGFASERRVSVENLRRPENSVSCRHYESPLLFKQLPWIFVWMKTVLCLAEFAGGEGAFACVRLVGGGWGGESRFCVFVDTPKSLDVSCSLRFTCSRKFS